MSYEYAMSGAGALGYSDPRATCSEISGGETRCFRPREASAAASYRCRTLNQSCQVSGDSGTTYCCPQFGTTRVPAASQGAPATSGGGTLTQAVNTMKGILGFGVGVTQITTDGTGGEKQTADGVAAEAQNIAWQETANAAEEAAGGAPVGAPIQPWYQQYQMPIMIGTALVGLLTTIIWLIARKR
jgi:hypothetical protein